ncbi:Mitotic spindle checkpoint component mad2 [Physocladia obscura]|uniref:Mitotic spindle checkpoint component mad2 n=1 Tax=Physocladia obscura TaxID=109957 RepID=A0AAD5T7L2_9FUNG|nr:Mitotic spindle checkpoint component mad2 [Physocladia obscura]
MATIQKQKQITLRGSAQIVSEFFDFSINSILFQRGIYPPEDFKVVKRYGLNLLVNADYAVQNYLKQIMSQVQKWIQAKQISKLVLVVTSLETREVVERWQFNIQLEEPTATSISAVATTTAAFKKPVAAAMKTEKEINNEIAAIMRQITASVSFLPMMTEPCTFNVLTYTDKNAEVPATWIDSDAKLITKNAEQVRLRSFSTSVHKVDALVAYRLDDE